jgi:hypothetical protein
MIKTIEFFPVFARSLWRSGLGASLSRLFGCSSRSPRLFLDEWSAHMLKDLGLCGSRQAPPPSQRTTSWPHRY